jgi:putative hydrolase of the HAD superfamily
MLLYNCRMRYRLLMIDLDDTLYPSSNGVWKAISNRMDQYLVERLNFPYNRVSAIREGYFERYGTTLRGLQIHHQVDANEFMEYVHDIPLDHLLQPDPELRSLLLSLPQVKWICTNADRNHARRVLLRLGVEDCFAGIIDVSVTNFIPKPSKAFYQHALHLAGEYEPLSSVLFDDLPRNLAPAQEMGITTVLVKPGIQADPSASLTIPNLHVLPQFFPELWEG